MARRRVNLSRRDDIEPDALRQRRDLYALAIGLLLFNIAGGAIVTNTTFGSLLPITLRHPWVLLCAAWVGFSYFWIRFWLVSKGRPFGDFLDDITIQAADSKAIRRIAVKHVIESHNSPLETQQAKILQRSMAPGVSLRRAELDLQTLINTSATKGAVYSSLGPKVQLEGVDRWRYWRAVAGAVFKAMVKERAFTDYTLPHLFAILTVVVGLVRIEQTIEAMTPLNLRSAPVEIEATPAPVPVEIVPPRA